MKISIITICYNSAETIGDTISSVASQDYPNIEYIIVDGGSDDGTVETIKLCEEKISHWISEPDDGLYDAMNKGLAMASGDIVGFLHADDVYADEGVLTSVAREIASGGLDALLGDVEFFSQGMPNKSVRRYRSEYFRPERIAWGWMPAHPALFLKRKVYDHFGGFRIDYQIAGDFEFVARIFKDGWVKYGYFPEVLVRMRTGGVSTGGWRSTIQLNREVMRACRENDIKTNLLKIMSKYPLKIMEFFWK